MSARDDKREIYFVSGDIFGHVTGGTLCDRMIVEELGKSFRVRLIEPHTKALLRFERPLLAGLFNNIVNIFRRFPRGSLVFIDHGNYRDCFVATHFWKWLYGCRVVGIVYHLDCALPQIHGGQRLRGIIEKALARTYDFVLTISRSTADHLERLGHPSVRTALIPVSRRFGLQEFRARQPTETVNFLFVGVIEPRKGLRDAIEALGAYPGPERIVFDCVGNCARESEHFRELVTLAARFPKVTVRFVGTVSQESLINYFHTADVFLFPSHWEGYGIAIEEAMCFGLPVIAYAAGAVSELVEDGVTGWLGPIGDPKTLARMVAECISNPLERERRGVAGLGKAERVIRERDLPKSLAHAIAIACATT